MSETRNRAKSALSGALGILAPIFVGTDRQAKRQARRIVENIDDQRRARTLNQPPPAALPSSSTEDEDDQDDEDDEEADR
jgi:hypothetical protein